MEHLLQRLYGVDAPEHVQQTGLDIEITYNARDEAAFFCFTL